MTDDVTVAASKQRGGWTDDVRSRALELYEDVGPTEAARMLGPDGPDKSTITRWAKAEGIECQRNERTAAATEAMRVTWKNRRAGLANDYGEASAEALQASREAIASGRANDARGYMITAAVATDKADVLAGITSQPSLAIPLDMESARVALEQILGGRGAIDVTSTEVLADE